MQYIPRYILRMFHFFLPSTVVLSRMCDYKDVFEDLRDHFQDSYFCNAACKTSVRIDSKRGGIFIAMVGPPARGKSATFEVLHLYYTQGPRARSVTMYNAGDFRRKWEIEVKRKYSALGVDKFIELCRDKGYASDASLLKHRADLRRWLQDAKTSAIPGHVFADFKSLNDAFAKVCINEGIKSVAAGNIVVLDATNTDIARRRYIIKRFQTKLEEANNKRAAMPHRLLFIENVCFDPSRLMKNFSSKLLGSGDYKEQVRHDCQGVRPLEATITRYLRQQDLLELPCKLISKGVAGGCEYTVLKSMKDITSRDRGYLAKYAPLHVSKDRKRSTISSIVASNSRYIGYIQILNAACRSSAKKTERTSLYTTNVVGDLPHFLASFDVSDKKSGSSYGQQNRAAVDAKKVSKLL